MPAQIQGLAELNKKLTLMKENFDGRRLNSVLIDALRPVRDQARQNVRIGPTGLTRQGITLFAGKKATRFGAVAVVRAKWRGTGAIFEEWGTKERVFSVMKVASGKLGGLIQGKVLKSGRFGKGSAMGFGGFLFFRKAAPMQGTRFFENAVDERLPDAMPVIVDGCKDIIEESIR